MIWGSQDIDGSVGVETGMTRASAELEYIFKCTYQVFEASIFNGRMNLKKYNT